MLLPTKPEVLRAIEDLIEGGLKWRLWTRMGWLEIRRRYKRTVLGPFWASLSLAIFATSLGIIFSTLWGMEMKNYLPFLTSGLIVWSCFSTTLQEGSLALTSGEGILTQIKTPYSLFIYVVLWRNVIVFFHHIVVYIAVALIFQVKVSIFTPLVIIGLVLQIFNTAWMAFVLAIICTRFRDIQQLIQHFLQIAMFLTPIFWKPTQLEGLKNRLLVDFNFMFHIIDVVRAPMLGNMPALNSYVQVLVMGFLGWALALFMYAKYRDRLIFWL